MRSDREPSIHQPVVSASSRRRARSLRAILAATTALTATVLTTAARAASPVWVGGVSVDWFTAGNWNTAAVPNASDTVTIDTTTPNTTILNGGAAAAQQTFVGVAGQGALAIGNGGTLSGVGGTTGFLAGGNGTISVQGAGSAWNNTGDITIGRLGLGGLGISNGGSVTDVNATVAALAGSTGVVLVTGAGATWVNSGDLNIGDLGTAALSISNGASVSSVNGVIGNAGGSTGGVVISGAGASWSSSNDLLVGSSGVGSVTIQNGGALTNLTGSIGVAVGSTGSAILDGLGSTWTNIGALYVGDNGQGAITIRNGGALRDGVAVIGSSVSSTGLVTVDGAGSSFFTAVGLTLGHFGQGTLTLRNGGVASAANLIIGELSGSTGTLNIGSALGLTAAAPGTLNTPTVVFGAGSGQVVFNHTAANYVFAPTIAGLGSVVVAAGTTALTANNTYTGPTTINGGTLEVDGSIASSNLTTVNAGGTLSGTGTVGNTLINGGTLAPGSSASPFAPLGIQGSLSFTAASTYLIQVSPNQAGLTNVAGVSGSATLGSATVNAVFAPGTYVAKQYTILTASGGINGTFNPAVVSNLSTVQSTLTYDSNDVFLNVQLSFAPPSGNLSVNQRNVADALTNFFNSTGGIPAAFAALSPAGLSLASGELGTGAIQSSIKADDLFLNLLLDPFVSGRAAGFTQSAPANGVLSYAGRPAAEREAYAMAVKAPAPLGYWSSWAAGYGGSQMIGGDKIIGSQGTTARIWGGAAGADYRLSNDTLVGFALGGGATSYSLADGFGAGSADLFQAGAFARHGFGPAYIAGALGFGWHDVTTTRIVALGGFDTLQGRFRADSYSGRIETGYRILTQLVGITPYAAVQAIAFNLPAYAEQSLTGGPFALNYAAATTSDIRTELGFRTDKSLVMADGVLTLRGRLAWAHDENPDRAVTAIFQSLPGASFVVNGARPSPDSALVSGSAEQKWLNGISLGVAFEGEFARNTTSYTGKGMVRYSW